MDMWFHEKGAEGAGIYDGISLDSHLRKIGRVNLQEVRCEDLQGDSDGEIMNGTGCHEIFSPA